MDLALGIPTRQAATRPSLVRDWIEHADAGPYRSVAVTERITDQTLEPLTVLATAVGMTRRVRLLASVIVAPAREVTLLARQAATLDALSEGRLSLGLGVGARRQDYDAMDATFGDRGRRFDAQLSRLRDIWDGPDDAPRMGPPTPRRWGPELLIAGYVDAVARRVATFGDGYMAPGGGSPDAIRALWERIGEAWVDAGRAGRPRFLAGTYYALGPDAGRLADDYILETYGHDPQLAERRRAALPTGPAAVLDAIEQAERMGVDEFVLRPCGSMIDQAEALTTIVSS